MAIQFRQLHDMAARGPNKYTQILSRVFAEKHSAGDERVEFTRNDLLEAAAALGFELGNIGDLIYSFRFRYELPEEIQEHAPEDREWVIRLAGRAVYAFELVDQKWITPNPALVVTKIPDATPAIISRYALNDEQAVLAILRYNRLIDIFLGITCYSLQSHLRTTVEGLGQIETDEVYLGIDVRGAQYLVPVQAKGGSDTLGVVQIEQDFELANKPEFADLIARPIGAQFIDDSGERTIALFEFEIDRDGVVGLAREKHYKLVPPDELSGEDLAQYGQRSFD